MKLYSFTLSLPPTTNQTYKAVYSSRLKRTVFFMSYPAKKWKKGVHEAIKTTYNLPELITEDVEFTIKWYLKYNRDIDGGLKLLLDSFEKSLIENDKQIKALHMFKEKDNKNPRVEVFIKPL